MRASTQVHVEYELFKAILDSEAIAEVIEDVRDLVVPQGDGIAQRRFNEGIKSGAKFIENLMVRRLHRLPENHDDYTIRE
tara:strand:+ start:1066 stop:1305 length:240 start_codon:yes stop_codon:yes gene_type:complete